MTDPGDPERPERPEYNVYRGGSGGRGRGRRAEQPQADAEASAASSRPDEGEGEGTEHGAGYTVYKARRGFKRPSGSPLGSIRDRLRSGGGSGSRRPEPGERPLWRRVLKWAALALGAWLLLSLVLFAVSAQIQKGKLDDSAGEALGGFPLLVASGQTILVMGTDARPEGTEIEGVDVAPNCLDKAATGAATANVCNPPYRADTLMLVRAGGGAFEKLSIPRDTLAEIPGEGSQKINAAYAFGGAQLQIETIENFLGIEIDHAVILDFEGFGDFIDALGGVEVALRDPVKSDVDGGAAAGGVSLDLERGRVELDGQQALALARTRENLKDPSEGDAERAQRQQLILAAIQDRLTSPTRIPYNLLHAPWIAWNAPKAMVSDMGGLTLPQLAIAAGIGGDSSTQILPTDPSTGIVDQGECEKAVEKFLGEEGRSQPACSPAG